jgi:predicted GIY-YIG superfamily endonuclease
MKDLIARYEAQIKELAISHENALKKLKSESDAELAANKNKL